MKIVSKQLLVDLTQRVERATEAVQAFRELSIEQLNFKKHPESWSVLECLEHLNLYGDFYLPEMEKQILGAKYGSVHVFQSGVLGNYFANLMLPGTDKMKKMKSPKDKNPTQSQLSLATIDRFLKQQEHLQRLLEMAKRVDLTKTKTSISLSKWIRLRLGDTFRFYVFHIQRHILQAEKIPLRETPVKP